MLLQFLLFYGNDGVVESYLFSVLTHWSWDKMDATLADGTFRYKYVNENDLIPRKKTL